MEAGTLLNRYLDEFGLCDEFGWISWSTSTTAPATCMTVSVPMALSVIARETKKARLLSLGNPIANRPDPVRSPKKWPGSTVYRAAASRWGW